MDERVTRALVTQFDPQTTLLGVARSVFPVAPFDRFGTAVMAPGTNRFKVVGLVDRRVDTRPSGSGFSALTSAGGWVARYRMPFIGATIDDVRGYPGTLASMERDQFGSNCVLPLDFGPLGSGVLYLLARRPRAFSTATLNLCMRVRDVVEPATRAYVAAMDLHHGGVVDENTEAEGAGEASGDGADRSLATMERRHIEAVLRDTNGIIEGPRGAAKVLGMSPSTLRHRMAALGVSRQPRRGQSNVT